MNASAEIANFSSSDARLKITLRGNGAPLATRELAIAAGGYASASFEGLPLHAFFEAEIDSRDALDLDNRSFAVASTTKMLRILGISPRPQELNSLRAITGVELDIVAPADYEKSDRSRYGLEIFHFAAPAVLPRNPALFIFPPNQSELVDLRERGHQPVGVRMARRPSADALREFLALSAPLRPPAQSTIAWRKYRSKRGRTSGLSRR